MLADISSICAGSIAVTALIGSNPMRLYAFGEAPQNVQKPYVVWQTITGSPNNSLADLPEDDEYAIQINVWADTKASATAVAKAISDAIDASAQAYVSSWNGESKDATTGNFGFSFSADFIEQRL